MPTGAAWDSIPVVDQLLAELASAAHGGRAVFLHGRADSPIDATAREFIRHARRTSRRLRIAIGDAGDPQTPAWRQIAIRLTRAERTGAALRRSVSEWAGVIPVLGPIIGAALSTADELRGPSDPADGALGTGSSIDDVRWLLAHGRNTMRLIVLENLHAADAAELSGAFALIQQLKGMKTMLLITSVADRLRIHPAVLDLLREAERLGVGRAIGVAPPPGDEGLTLSQAELLRCARTLGPRFAAAELAHALQRSSNDVEEELGRLAKSKLITLVDTVEVAGELTDLFEFVPATDTRS